MHVGNWLAIGPITVRIGSKHLAKWGYERLRIGGLSLWSRDTGGRLHLAGYHPKGSLTWHWFVAFYRSAGARRGYFNLQWRRGYGERGLSLFGWTISLTEQGYHRETGR